MKNIYYSVVLLTAFCHQSKPLSEVWQDSLKSNLLTARITNSIVSNLTLDEKIGQMLLPYFQLKNTKDIYNSKAGTLFIHTNNIPQNKNQKQDIILLKKRIHSINQWYIEKNIPKPLYTIDQEHGHVVRLLREMPQFPSQMSMGIDYDLNKDPNRIAQVAFTTCRALLNIGIQWNLAPVVDLQSNLENPVIRTRSFSTSEETITALSKAYLSGLHKARCMDAIKHFPGHGSTSIDSHLALPIIHKLENNHIRIFKDLIEYGNPLSIMTAHILVPSIDNQPITLSKIWLTNKLRNDMNFDGIIISDDLGMNALQLESKADFKQVVITTIKAGIDVLLLFSKAKDYAHIMHTTIKQAVLSNEINKQKIEQSVARIIERKLLLGILDKQLSLKKFQNKYKLNSLDTDEWLKYSSKLSQMAEKIEINIDAKLLARQISAASIRTIHRGKYDWKNKHKYLLFSDASELLEKIKDSRDLKSLNDFESDQPVVIVNVEFENSKDFLVEVLKKENRKYPLLIYSVINPLPFSSFGKYLRKQDMFISSFSRSIESQNALIQSYLSNDIPKSSNLYD